MEKELEKIIDMNIGNSSYRTLFKTLNDILEFRLVNFASYNLLSHELLEEQNELLREQNELLKELLEK